MLFLNVQSNNTVDLGLSELGLSENSAYPNLFPGPPIVSAYMFYCIFLRGHAYYKGWGLILHVRKTQKKVDPAV